MTFRLLLLLVLGAAASQALPANKVQPRHDPPDQIFRRAPMTQAARTIVLNLGTNLHAAFDAELCRLHTVWTGGSLGLVGPPYSYAKAPFICTFDGDAVYRFPQRIPWNSPAEFQAIETSAGPLLEYSVGHVTIREALAGHADGRAWTLTRAFSFRGNTGSSLECVLVAELEAAITVNGAQAEVRSPEADYQVALAGPAWWRTESARIDESVELITEEGTEKGNPRVPRRGVETRLILQIERGATNATVTFSHLAAKLAPAALPPPSASHFSAGPPRPPSGDAYYKIEHFNLPPQAELIVTGMDALPDGDLIVCTWLGEVYRIGNSTGPPGKATFRRIARGLNEPLGLAVLGETIFVVQKGELTRLLDLDGDGRIDRYECVNASWGYSGNYHSYSFGPVVLPNRDLAVFVTGQRGRADLLYQGWALRMDAQTGRATPVCDGLRVPHGSGLFQGDLFVSDNQGNWIGACKLNHLQAGRFYGFPSSRPSPPGPRPPESVTPPAVWFPRALSPSTSGFDTIQDDRFGPFEGQMLIGDFQNAIAMRVFLEKVNGAWQGAVFPFAKGFLSGVNRLKMNRDGKLYVGGGKRTWSTAAPNEWSLDRVSFTGRVPFEVKQAGAEPDGFTLTFTKPLEPGPARDPENYLVKQFGYRYHADYGSPEFDQDGKPGATELPVASAMVSEDGLQVRLAIPGLKPGYVTSFRLAVNSADDEDLRNDAFYYTLNAIPAPAR